MFAWDNPLITPTVEAVQIEILVFDSSSRRSLRFFHDDDKRCGLIPYPSLQLSSFSSNGVFTCPFIQIFLDNNFYRINFRYVHPNRQCGWGGNWPTYLKDGDFFIMSMRLTEPIFKNLQSNVVLWQTPKQKFPLQCTTIKEEIFVFCLEAPFDWKCLKIGSVIVL